MKRSARGFTLVEALVALVVLAFGMMALAGFQTSLSRNSDIAKQRTEATRLAQQKMEELRSLAWASLAGGSDNPVPAGGNASYVRSWDLSAPSQDPWRSVTVTVRWSDRAGEVNTVNLSSTISRAATADGAVLGLPQVSDGILHRPRGRPLGRYSDMPVPTISVGGGQRAVELNGDGFVFSEVTGEVINYCTTVKPTPQGCISAPGYLLAGYINDGSIDGVAAFAFTPTSIGWAADLEVQVGTSPKCIINPVVNPNDPTELLPDFLFYLCVLTPSTTLDPPFWSGTPLLQRSDGTKLTGEQKVCRYKANLNYESGRYENITRSLDNQNYLILGSGDCPIDTKQHQSP